MIENLMHVILWKVGAVLITIVIGLIAYYTNKFLNKNKDNKSN